MPDPYENLPSEEKADIEAVREPDAPSQRDYLLNAYQNKVEAARCRTIGDTEGAAHGDFMEAKYLALAADVA